HHHVRDRDELERHLVLGPPAVIITPALVIPRLAHREAEVLLPVARLAHPPGELVGHAPDGNAAAIVRAPLAALLLLAAERARHVLLVLLPPLHHPVLPSNTLLARSPPHLRLGVQAVLLVRLVDAPQELLPAQRWHQLHAPGEVLVEPGERRVSILRA